MGYQPKPIEGTTKPGAFPLPSHCWARLRRHEWGEPVITDSFYASVAGWPLNTFPRWFRWTCRRCYRTRSKIIPMVAP